MPRYARGLNLLPLLAPCQFLIGEEASLAGLVRSGFSLRGTGFRDLNAEMLFGGQKRRGRRFFAAIRQARVGLRRHSGEML